MSLNKKFMISTIILLLIFTIGIFLNGNKKHKYVNIDDLACEAYASEEEYEPNIKKHMAIKVYNSSNVCTHFRKAYGKPPLNIYFKFKEFNQKKKDDKIFVYMKYDANFTHPIDKIESIARDNLVVFQVVEKDGHPYIEKKIEFKSIDDIPKDIKGFFNKII